MEVFLFLSRRENLSQEFPADISTSYWPHMGNMTISTFGEDQKHEYLAFLPFYGKLALPLGKMEEEGGYGDN